MLYKFGAKHTIGGKITRIPFREELSQESNYSVLLSLVLLRFFFWVSLFSTSPLTCDGNLLFHLGLWKGADPSNWDEWLFLLRVRSSPWPRSLPTCGEDDKDGDKKSGVQGIEDEIGVIQVPLVPRGLLKVEHQTGEEPHWHQGDSLNIHLSKPVMYMPKQGRQWLALFRGSPISSTVHLFVWSFSGT